MNDALKMQISAFVDGELTENESELLLRRLSQDATMRQLVAEYLEIGRMLRRDREVPGMLRLREQLAGLLGNETQPERIRKPVVGSRFMTPASGIAVAATVAAVALFGLGQVGAPVDNALQDALAIDLAPAYTEPTVEQVFANQPTQRLLDLRRRHGDSSPQLGSGDILYRMATFEIRQGELVEIEPDPFGSGASRPDTTSDPQRR